MSAVWGKDPENLAVGGPPYPLAAHLLDTTVVMGVLWDIWLRPGLRRLLTEAVAPGDPGKTRSTLMLLAALHDIGKANPIFQLQSGDSRSHEWRPLMESALDDVGLPSPAADLVGHCRLPQPSGRLSYARRHEYVGYVALTGKHLDNRDKIETDWIPLVLSGHHGRWMVPTDTECDATDLLVDGRWGDVQNEHRQLVETALGVSLADVENLTKTSALVVVLSAGLLTLSDWLASDDVRVEQGQTLITGGFDPVADPAGWLAGRSEEMLAHVKETVGTVNSLEGAEEFIMAANSPRPLQQDAIEMDAVDGLWTVMYPTGEGKTEAALLRHAARRQEGLIFALPTRATTDAMTERLRRIWEQTGNPVIKSHQFAAGEAKRLVSCCGEDLYRSEWFTSSIRRLVSPFAAMTCDQVLAAALRQRQSPLRLLALANSHVVLDEVHTFDRYQTSLLKQLLGWFGATNTRVTLLSATLPEWQARELRDAYAQGATADARESREFTVQYPSHNLFSPHNDIDQTTTNGELSSEIDSISFELDASADRRESHVAWATVTAKAHPGSHHAVIVNTVKSAIQIATDLKTITTHDVLCLHSRMTQGHRREVEDSLLTRLGKDSDPNARPLIVVATQVIEASLDIDFDLMSTDLAPAPSLIQRAGRLWRFADNSARTARHAKSPVAPSRTLRVVSPVTKEGHFSKDGCRPYESAELDRARDWLTEHPQMRVPEDVQEFVETSPPDLGDESRAAAEEVGNQMVRVESAALSRSELIKDLLTKKSPRYSALVSITTRHDAEELMRTRFIDQQGATFMLFDSRQGAMRNPVAVKSAFTKEMEKASPSEVLSWLHAVVPVSFGVTRTVLPFHEKTLRNAGIAGDWEPASRMFTGLLPLDLALVPAAIAWYSDFSGFTQRSEI